MDTAGPSDSMSPQEYARLYRETQRRLAEMTTVQQVARAVNSTLQLEHIFREIVEQISRTFGYNLVSVYLVDGDRLVLQAQVGYTNVIWQIGFDQGVSGQVVRSGQAVFVRDIADHPDFIFADERVRQEIIVPLISGDYQVLGTLSVESTGTPELTDDDFRLMKLLADQMSVAVLNARLYSAVQRELAERQLMERKMLEAQKLESLGVVVGGVAHDFNNLLTVVLGNTQLALFDVDETSPAYESIMQIDLAARHAADLIKQMLAYAGRGHVVTQRVDLSQVIEEMIGLLQSSITRSITLRFDLARDLPPIEADMSQLRQVVMNLAINAAEAIGTVEGRVEVRTRLMTFDRAALRQFQLGDQLTDGDYPVLEVRDTGRGMDEATRMRIFDPFFSTKFAGRGLGLAAVLGIIRDHRGAIQVRSAPGQGTTFTVLLPPSRKTAATAVPEAVLASQEQSTWGVTGPILVVDDEPGVRTIVSQALARIGVVALEAADGREAIAYLRADPAIVCVLLDLIMPVLGGAATFQSLRIIRPELPVILMSGYDAEDVLANEVEMRRLRFLRKPFTPAEVLATLQGALTTDK